VLEVAEQQQGHRQIQVGFGVGGGELYSMPEGVQRLRWPALLLQDRAQRVVGRGEVWQKGKGVGAFVAGILQSVSVPQCRSEVDAGFGVVGLEAQRGLERRDGFRQLTGGGEHDTKSVVVLESGGTLSQTPHCHKGVVRLASPKELDRGDSVSGVER
jgi:hypothetical protein